MVKKLKELADGAAAEGGRNLSDAVRESASSIWLAGMGAFAKAQAEGGKVFETLVKEGKALESQTRKFAEEKLQGVTQQFGRKAEAASAKATASWDKLEQVFEDRVARSLTRLGVPTSKEIQALAARVEALTGSVQRLNGADSSKAAPDTKSAGRAKKVVAVANPAPARRRVK